MSKAFTREDDEAPEMVLKKPIAVDSNYITPAGLNNLRQEEMDPNNWTTG